MGEHPARNGQRALGRKCGDPRRLFVVMLMMPWALWCLWRDERSK